MNLSFLVLRRVPYTPVLRVGLVGFFRRGHAFNRDVLST